MKIAIVGCGAIGGYVGAKLARASTVTASPASASFAPTYPPMAPQPMMAIFTRPPSPAAVPLAAAPWPPRDVSAGGVFR